MAINWGRVEAFTRDFVEPGIKDQIFESTPLLAMLDAKGIKEKSGKNLRVLVQYAKNSGAGSYKGGDILPTVSNEKFGDTELGWRQSQSGPIVLNGDEEFKNSGPEQIADIVQAEVDNAKESIRDILSDQLFSDGTGNDSKDITGLIAAVDSGANVATYAGIARATYPWWASGYINMAATAISLGSWRANRSTRSDGAIKPDLAIMSQAIYDKTLGVSGDPIQRLTNTKVADLGFENMSLDGMTLMVDPSCPTASAWLLNMKYLELYGAKGRNFVLEPFQKPVNQDARITRILWAGQLVNTSCRRHARIYGLSTAV